MFAVYLIVLATSLLHSATSICPNDSFTDLQDVHLGLMTAADNRLRFVSVGCIPAIELAVEMINNSTDLLQGYRLTHNDYIDTGCERRTAYNRFFDFIESSTIPDSIAILGAGCSAASEPIAELAPFWNTMIMSYVSSSPVLSNRILFPNFYRTYISDALVAPAFVQLVKSFGWTKITIITENESVFAGNLQEQINLLEVDGIDVKSFMFESDEFQSDKLQAELDYTDHIFFINSFENAARDILCFFYRAGKRYPAYAFITHAWFQEEWYLKDTTACEPRQVEQQLHRTITFIPFIVNMDRDTPTYSGLNVHEFDKLYRERLINTKLLYQLEAYPAFDSVYALAIALDRVQRAVCAGDSMGCTHSENLTSIEHFKYHNAQLECMLKAATSMTNFSGISGPVMFDGNGTRIINTFEIKQYQLNSNECHMSTCHVTIGSSNGVDKTFEFLYGNTNSSVWPDDVPPDGTPMEETNTLPLPLIIIVDIFVIVGIVFSVFCLVFNIIFRNKKIIKLSSPTVNYVIIGGAVLSYLSVILFMLPGTDTHSLTCRCNVAHLFSIFGYTLSFTAVLAKMWRVYYIFHNPTTKKRSIKDWHLLIIVAVLAGIMLFMLILSDAIPVLRTVPERVKDPEFKDTINDLDVTIQYFVFACTLSTEALVAVGMVLGYAFVLQLIAIILAFQTRKVKIKGLNDARQVIAIIYINTICLLVFTLTSVVLNTHLITSSVLYSISITAAATVFLTLLFIPKMISLYRDPEGKAVFSTSTQPGTANGTSNGTSGNSSTGPGRRSIVTLATAAAGIDDTKVIIQRLENRVSELKEELDQYEPAVPPSAMKKKVSIQLIKNKLISSLSISTENDQQDDDDDPTDGQNND